MKGGTEFRFVTEGMHAALQQAQRAASGGDIRIGGGVSTIRQYLRAGLIDELHVAIRPCCSVPANTCSTASTRAHWVTNAPEHVAGERAMTNHAQADGAVNGHHLGGVDVGTA